MKAVIFDMDGVLLDTESVCKICWSRAADEYGIENIQDAFTKCVGQNTNDTMTVLAPYCNGKVEPKKFYERTSELFHVVENEVGLKLMPSVVECLDFLKSRNLRLAVASSTRFESVSRQLKNAGIIGYFETITTGDKVEHSKPAPDIYLKSVESLSLSPSECVAVEDSPNGVRAAVAAGIKCVMVPDQIQPDDEMRKSAWRIINSLSELPPVISECL